MSDEIVVGGRRARGARRRRTSQNIEDVAVTEVELGDRLIHQNFRDPLTVNEIMVVQETGIVTLVAREATWQIASDATVRRVTEPEEAEG